jgi:hypothetical protein
MEITRKVFYNKANGQASITLPSNTLKQIEKNLKLTKPLDKISLKIFSRKEVHDFKPSQQ